MKLQLNENFFWKIARHHFLIFSLLLLFALTWGILSFFENFVLVKEEMLRVVFIKKQFNEELYEEIIGKEKKAIEEILQGAYLDPFELKATSTEEK
jgi:hypothetical protein